MTRLSPAFEVFVGWDSREVAAYQVCVQSMRERSAVLPPVTPLVEPHLRAAGLYRRRHERRDGRLWDLLSDAPMSTEFALTRFLVPQLARSPWALFCDADFLWRSDVAELLALADDRYALMVVPHQHAPQPGIKMDGQLQTVYPRKNWSSLMLWNCAHPAHAALPKAMAEWPGRDLHALRWLPDDAIGHLPQPWNWLEGSSPAAMVPKAVHYTRGTPDMSGYEHSAYSDEWRAVRARVGA